MFFKFLRFWLKVIIQSSPRTLNDRSRSQDLRPSFEKPKSENHQVADAA